MKYKMACRLIRVMQNYVVSRLPSEHVDAVVQACLRSKTPEQSARQFCAHYKVNAPALNHFSISELLHSPELWFVLHPEGNTRAGWLEAVYPKHIEKSVDITDSVLQCTKCKKNSVDYYEKQTRGADEPMTLFAHCLNCGHRWRQ